MALKRENPGSPTDSQDNAKRARRDAGLDTDKPVTSCLQKLQDATEALRRFVEETHLKEADGRTESEQMETILDDERSELRRILFLFRESVQLVRDSDGIPYRTEHQKLESKYNLINLIFAFECLHHYIERVLPWHEKYTRKRRDMWGDVKKQNQLVTLRIILIQIMACVQKEIFINDQMENKSELFIVSRDENPPRLIPSVS